MLLSGVLNQSKKHIQPQEVFGEKKKKKMLLNQMDLVRLCLKKLCELKCIIKT